MAVVDGGLGLRRGIRQDFADVWRLRGQRELDRYKGVVEVGIPQDNYVEEFGDVEPAPMPSILPWHREPSEKAFRLRTNQVVTRRVASSFQWGRMQDEMSPLLDIGKKTAEAADRFVNFPIRVFIQQITGTADHRLLPRQLNAPDGAPPFSATAGDGSDRNGVSGGNLIGSTPLSSGPNIRDATMAAIERICSFTEPTEQQPWIDEADVEDGGLLIMAPIGKYRYFNEAFRQNINIYGATSGASNAAVTNIFQDMGMEITLVLTARLTADEMYVFPRMAPVPFFFETKAMALWDHIWTEDNDRGLGARGIREWIGEKWAGYGQNQPFAVKITAA